MSQNNSPIQRPGISSAMLARCQIRAITEAEAERIFGHPYAGLLLPYLDLDSNPILDCGAPYFRDRLAKPEGDMKYFQKRGTKPHAYLPPGLKDFPKGTPLIVVEGEFKAISLVEAGYAAVGSGGFYGYAEGPDKSNKHLVGELQAVIAMLEPRVIYFLGDSDTSTNYQFSDAALKLAKMVTPVQVLLPRIPLKGPGKGADDCREALGLGFNDWFNSLLDQAQPVDTKWSNAELALILLRPQVQALPACGGTDHTKNLNRLIQMAAYMTKAPLQQDEVITIVCQSFGLSRTAVKTAVKLARQELLAEIRGTRGNGFRPGPGSPQRKRGATPGKRRTIIPLPCQQFLPNTSQFTSISDTAAALFPLFAATGVHFQRNGAMCMVASDQNGFFLNNLSAAAFRTEAEKLDALLMRHVMSFGYTSPQLVQSFLKENEATALLASREARMVPPITGLASCPIMVPKQDGGFRVVESGYDPETRIYVTSNERLPILPPLDLAKNMLLGLLPDFRWKTPADKSRALAMLLTPALKMGRCIQCLTPMFMTEADESQTGKGYVFDLAAAVYNQPISLVPQHSGKGVGSTEESFFRSLSRGYPFIIFDNWRGQFDCATMEEFLTNRHGRFEVRLPYEKYITVDPSFYIVGMTSNGLQLTTDQVNRTVLIRLLKQPQDYAFRAYAEGDLLDHVRVNWLQYLAAAYSIVQEWGRQNKPRTSMRLDSFSYWAQCLDWIVQNLFGQPSIGAGLLEERARLSDPSRTFARELALVLAREGALDQRHTAKMLANFVCIHGLKVPGLREDTGLDAAAKVIGITMRNLFQKGTEQLQEVEVDGFTIQRSEITTPRPDGAGGGYTTKVYTFLRRQQPG